MRIQGDKMIIRVTKDKNNPYVILNKGFLNRNDLSWKAKGVLAYLLSLPDDWQINVADLQKRSTDGKVGTRTGIKELMDAGYINRKMIKNETGKICGYEYTVKEVPDDSEIPTSGKPTAQIVPTQIVPTQNVPLLNNDYKQNNDSTNKPSKQKFSADFEEAQRILEVWNKYFVKHAEDILKKNLKKDHYDIIHLHGVEEICKAIEVYDEISKSHEYYFTHRGWRLWEFLTRGLHRFLPDADPYNSMKKEKKKEYSDSKKALEEFRKKEAGINE